MSDSAAGWEPGPAWLLCPAGRAGRYPQALAAADAVILDLEAASAEHAADVRLAQGAVPSAGHAVRMNIADVEGLAAEREDAVAVGFDATHVGENRGMTTFEGRRVDGPAFKQAERILRLAPLTGPSPETTVPREVSR